ncbi:hypothetical protein NFD60_12905 (plasmid) [Staphylococcus epidermidis]|nr:MULTISPECIES: hypothetical protein [Staphylococcus]MCG7819739.1 hypothetical protein [Staphylococcus epidermidis]UTP75707.1 hypothetical protein NFD60_13135 [Staphylococcus epidermidis]UTP75744.1 hypothetical protein NFD60_12850 [Staphylococcus epidermidis]UTP75754.1 hypothetical protein NFD60_12905 [Staphylococcus epidermidis]
MVKSSNKMNETNQEESIENRITDFFKNGGKYNEKEIDFGKNVGREI